MNDAYRSAIVCSTGRGIGADFWRRYKGPSEVLPEGARMEYNAAPVCIKTRGHVVVCTVCGVSFVTATATHVCVCCRATREEERNRVRRRERTLREKMRRAPCAV